MTRGRAWAALAALGAAYAAVAVPSWNSGHLDFGDGNYMYIGWRVANGATLYSDILAPQPPVHLLTGALLAKLGAGLSEPIFAFRAFSLILHLATLAVVYALTVRVATGPNGVDRPGEHGGAREAALATVRPAGLLAAAVYLVLPVGFWWCLGYQSEPTEMLFLLGGLLSLLRWTPRAAAVAGLLTAVGPLTNMTGAPYALFVAGWLLLRRPRLFLWFALPMAGLIAATTVIMQLTTGAYLENVILNQVGSFPRREVMGPGMRPFGVDVDALAAAGGARRAAADALVVADYALGKWRVQGGKVLALEGGFIAVGLLGLAGYAAAGRRRSGAPESPPNQSAAAEPPERELVSWYAFFALCSILFSAKGGTADYIFTIGEPFVAVFAGIALNEAMVRLTAARLAWRDLSAPAAWTAAAGVVLVLAFRGIEYNAATLKQNTYELPELPTRRLADAIRGAAPPGAPVLVPPHYAFLARRRIALDYAELYLWTIKYRNEKADGVDGRGVAAVNRLAAMIRAKEIAFVALDMNQTGRLPEITSALAETYDPATPAEVRSLNTTLKLYRPRR